MSTAELYLSDDEIREFIAETKIAPQYFYGEEGSEYGVCPFITFYIYTPNHSYNEETLETYDEDFLPLCREVIELHQELQTLIDEPYQQVLRWIPEDWLKATPQNLGREFLWAQAEKAYKRKGSLWLGATTDESPAASARWAIAVRVDDHPEMCYTTVKITFRDKWYRTGNNRQVWHAFVQKWLARLRPEQCYSGYEIGMAPDSIFGAYESDVMERLCADHFYGLDVDHPAKMGYHYNDRDTEYDRLRKEGDLQDVSKEDFIKWVNPTRIGSGLRTPTWCFLLSPLWRNKLGKSPREVKAALLHPDIRVTEIPYPRNKHNPNGEPALWVQLGELNLYPVDEGVPELPAIANKLIRPIRCDLLQLYTLDPWADDPNPRFNEENSPRWLARFDEDSDWPRFALGDETILHTDFKLSNGKSMTME